MTIYSTNEWSHEKQNYYTALKYAQKLEKEIINLANK